MRLQTFDYGTAGAYFVTICTKDRECILSQVTNEPPFLNLSQYGEIVEVWISKIEQKYSEIKVDRYVIMPDHIHLLLFVMRDTEKQYHVPVVESVIGWFKYQVSKIALKVFILSSLGWEKVIAALPKASYLELPMS